MRSNTVLPYGSSEARNFWVGTLATRNTSRGRDADRVGRQSRHGTGRAEIPDVGQTDGLEDGGDGRAEMDGRAFAAGAGARCVADLAVRARGPGAAPPGDTSPGGRG